MTRTERMSGPEPDVAPMHVHAQRAADREVGVRLHDLDREAVRIDELLDVAPADAGLHAHRLLPGEKETTWFIRRMSRCRLPGLAVCPPMLKRPPPIEIGPVVRAGASCTSSMWSAWRSPIPARD